MIISPTLHTAAIAGLEQAINAGLRLDPATNKKLAALPPQVFHLQCTSPALDIYLFTGQSDIRLTGIHEGPITTSLRGSSNELWKLASASDPANALINGALELHGDSHALIDLQKILSQLSIDWEAPLAGIFGDVISHQLGNSIRQGFQFANQALQSFKRQAGEYIVEESQLLAADWELDQFASDVQQLAMRAERLQARINKLASDKNKSH